MNYRIRGNKIEAKCPCGKWFPVDMSRVGRYCTARCYNRENVKRWRKKNPWWWKKGRAGKPARQPGAEER